MGLPPLTEIERARRKLGLTQTGLAKKASVSQSLIARLEAQTVDPRYSKVARIFEALDTLRAKEIVAAEIITPDVVGIQGTASIEFAAGKMKEHGVSQMPVLADDKIVGSFSEKTILDLLAKGYDARAFSSEEVSQHMDDAFPVVGTDTPLSVISALLEHNTAVMVQQQGKTQGIITKADLLKVVHQ